MCYSDSTSLESVSSRGEILIVCVSDSVVCVTAQVTNGTENVFFFCETLILPYLYCFMPETATKKNTKYLIILF